MLLDPSRRVDHRLEYVRQVAAIAALEGCDASGTPAGHFIRHPLVKAIRGSNCCQGPHPIWKALRHQGADDTTEGRADDVCSRDPDLIEEADDIVGVICDIVRGLHRSHQLPTKIAANDPVVLCKRSRDHLPRNRRHGNAIEEHQGFTGAIAQVEERGRFTPRIAHSETSPAGISKSTDLAAMKALSAGKKMSGRSM